jgi:hypothetical protein
MLTNTNMNALIGSNIKENLRLWFLFILFYERIITKIIE